MMMTHDEKTAHIKHEMEFITATAMKETSGNLRHWSQKLRYIFDINNPQARAAVIVFIYDIFSSRTLEFTVEHRPNKKKVTKYKSR